MKAIGALLVTALALTQGGFRAAGAVPAAIDPGIPEPGRGAADPGPSPDPEPATAGGDAEPAPAPPPPPPSATGTPRTGEDKRRIPRRRVALLPKFAYRLGQAGRDVTPAPGYGLAGTIEITYLRTAAVLEAALGIDFSYDRFATGEQGVATVEGVDRPFGSTRVISETSFILVHTAAAHLGPVRPYLTVGGGLGLGYFDSAAPDLRPGTARDTHFLGRASLGADISVGRAWNLAVRADFTAVRGTSAFDTTDRRRLALFGDLFDLGAGVAYRF